MNLRSYADSAGVFYLHDPGLNAALFNSRHNPLAFAMALARAESLDTKRFPSLADQCGVSMSAMAIRLVEAGLVVN